MRCGVLSPLACTGSSTCFFVPPYDCGSYRYRSSRLCSWRAAAALCRVSVSRFRRSPSSVAQTHRAPPRKQTPVAPLRTSRSRNNATMRRQNARCATSYTRSSKPARPSTHPFHQLRPPSSRRGAMPMCPIAAARQRATAAPLRNFLRSRNPPVFAMVRKRDAPCGSPKEAVINEEAQRFYVD